MVRAIRDKRFKYIRNCRPELPYMLWVPYRNRLPIVQEMWRVHMSGEASSAQSLMFRPSRPAEELYDTDADPYELNNLAGDPQHRDKLARLRAALDAWLTEVGDTGKMPESEMVRQWYPDGEQPRTAAPVFVPICESSPGTQPAEDAARLESPALVQIHCATQGASIAYTFDDGSDPHWLLYTAPLQLPPGTTSLRAKAIRIGYAESEERCMSFALS